MTDNTNNSTTHQNSQSAQPVDSDFYQSFIQNMQSQQPPAKKPHKKVKIPYLAIVMPVLLVVIIIAIVLIAIQFNKPVDEDSLTPPDPELRLEELDKLYTFLDDVANERWAEANNSMSNVSLETLDVCEIASYYRASIRLLDNDPQANVNRGEATEQIKVNSEQCGKWDNTTGGE